MKRALFSTIFIIATLLVEYNSSAQDKLTVSKEVAAPRMRVIVDNDFGGDPDGLFQLAHQLLSPSAEVRCIIGSFIKKGGFFEESETALSACKSANELLKTIKLDNKLHVYEGANSELSDVTRPHMSEGAKAIVKEAMREDTKLPLYVVCGAGLTDIASAYLMEPKIAKHLTLIWIGGPEYTDLTITTPGIPAIEYNMGIDIKAAQVIFNISDIPIWQVPRNTYRQALVSYSELLLKVKNQGDVGKFLVNKLEYVMKLAHDHKFSIGETYDLGDSPLVLLTALQSAFDADPSSSSYVLKAAPKINDTGLYETNATGRNIRVYCNLDTRLMFDDLFAKLALFNQQK